MEQLHFLLIFTTDVKTDPTLPHRAITTRKFKATNQLSWSYFCRGRSCSQRVETQQLLLHLKNRICITSCEHVKVTLYSKR